ncbi:MAG TPA: DUF2505 domain-containing protein [Acidimicrobiales bacterium]|nr:DUF2505 domain-containing protein [Acidimicrobiales bacterium]
MRFALDQDLPGTVEEVLDVLADPGFVPELGALPKVGPPELLEHRVADGTLHQRVRYRFTGPLSPAVTRVIDPDRLVWVDDTTYDLAAATATFRIQPEHYANRLRCSGRYRLRAAPGGCRRSIEGDLTVSYPLVGRAVERAILSGLEDHLGAEADLIGRWLARRA